MKWAPVRLALALLAGAAGLASRGGGFELLVNKSPITIEHVTLDPAHPTLGAPALVPPEAGVCRSEFHCESSVKLESGPPRAGTQQPGAIYIRSATVNLRLAITIWMPMDATPKIVAHEEGHRAIAEFYYRAGESILRGAADDLARGEPKLLSTESNASMPAFVHLWHGALLERYLAGTSRRCEMAQARYDAITAHGTNAIPEEKAMAQAIAEEQMVWSKRK